MHASNTAPAGLSTKTSNRIRAAERWAAKAKASMATVLAKAPVSPEPYHGPIVCELSAQVVNVDVEPLETVTPAGDWRTLVGKRTAAVAEVATTEGARKLLVAVQGRTLYPSPTLRNAAIRDQAAQALAYGPKVHVAALVVDGETVRRVIFAGTLAAVRQALPDHATVTDWVAAGVQEAVAWGLDPADGRRSVRWVAPEQAPKALQMELETRGLAAQVARL